MKFHFRNLSIVFVVFALLLAALACNFPSRILTTATPTLEPVPVTTEAAQELQQNLQMAATQASPDQTVTLTMTEEQLTSLIALELQKEQEPVLTDPQVHLRDGQIEVKGRVEQAGMRLPLTMIVTVSATEQGEAHFDVLSADLGPVSLPDGLKDEIEAQINRYVSPEIAREVIVEDVQVGDGVMTITGRPS
jgi:uncharacterized protein YpmS